MALFISGSGRPLPWAVCALGLDFNQTGLAELSPGTSQQQCPPWNDKRAHRQQKCCPAALGGWRAWGGKRGVLTNPRIQSLRNSPSPAVPDNSLALLSPGRSIHGRWHCAGPLQSCFQDPKAEGTWKGYLPFLLSWERFFISAPLSLEYGQHIFFCSQPPRLGSSFCCL